VLDWSEKGASEVGSGSGMFFDILCTIFIEYRITTVLKVETDIIIVPVVLTTANFWGVQ
jgi:hypothetical protein